MKKNDINSNELVVCLFGTYDPNYNRNLVLFRGLERNSVKVLQCRSDRKGWAAIKDLIKKHRNIKGQYKVLIVAYADVRYLVPLAKLLTNKLVVWDAFYSVHDSLVNDRKLVSKYSLKAMYWWCADWLSCCLADKILLDTYAHIKYFNKTFFIDENRFIRVLIGADYEALGVKQPYE